MKTKNILKKVHNAYVSVPKRASGIMAVAVAVVATSAVSLAWGPDRPTYTVDKPADHVTFDSITDNPMYGDERNFFRIKPADAPNSAYSDITKVEPGKDYIGYVYFHNDASSTLNDKKHNYKGIAKGTKLRIAIPGGVKANSDSKTGLSAFIYADNAKPKEIYDDAFLKSDVDVALRYIPNSAKIFSKGKVNGQTLPDGLIDNGTYLGYDSLNGVIPGCDEFSGYVTFKFRADAPNFTIKKQVSKHGANDWKDTITAKVGESVDYKIIYQNTGSVQQDKVVIKDKLPKGMEYNKGTSILANSLHPKGIATNDGVTTTGLKIGSYKSKGNAGIKYSATITDDLAKCGKNSLVNKATAITQNGNKSDTATVVVNKKCKKDECKPGIPKGDKRCNVQKKCDSGSEVDDKGNCIATPTELPTTGPTEVVLGLIGLGAVAAGIAYWVKSRRDLDEAIADAASGKNAQHKSVGSDKETSSDTKATVENTKVKKGDDANKNK